MNARKHITALRKAACIGALIALLAGCNDADKGRNNDQYFPPTITYTFRGNYTVDEFRLKDGTRCVRASYQGITCEWKK